MANEICPVCEMEISKFSLDSIQGVDIHDTCRESFYKNPEKYGGKPIEMSDETTDIDEETKMIADFVEERQQLEKEINDKSVYVKGFSMPFGEMVEFMVKWAIASIPAFIILTIIGAIIVAIFGSLFF